MRRFFLSAAALSVLALPAIASDVFVPSNTPTVGTCNAFPFSPGATAEWRYQAIFTAAQMGPAARITDLSVAPCTTGTFSATMFEIRMSHLVGLPSAGFDTNLPTPVVVRNAGPYSWSPVIHAWSPLKLDCPFDYNGIDNLTVEIRYTGGVIGGGFTGSCHRDAVAYRVYLNAVGAYTATTGSAPSLTTHKFRFTLADTQITGGLPTPGGTVTMLFDDSADAGLSYIGASSLGAGPIPIGCWQLELDPDALLILSSSGALPGTFQNFQGVLDLNGQATPAILLPNVNALIGLVINNAYVTLSGGAIKSVGRPARFVIQSS
jgi:hypothetical protein